MGLLFTGMLTLFFAVADAMQVSGASRRIQADQRMIGHPACRRGGERTLMGCYRLPVFLSAGCGVLLLRPTAALLLGGPCRFLGVSGAGASRHAGTGSAERPVRPGRHPCKAAANHEPKRRGQHTGVVIS